MNQGTGAANTLEVRNPRTGDVDYKFTPTTADELALICSRAREAQVKWEAMGLEGRIKVLKAWGERLKARRQELLDAVCADTGRFRESEREVDLPPRWIDQWADAARQSLASEAQQTANPLVTSFDDYSPYPLLGVISPWNFPCALSLMDAVPALIAGCAVVIKPSEVTPRFIDPMMATIEECEVLRDLLVYVRGAGDVGAALIDQVDMVCFTGSTQTGRKVAVRGAERFIPVFTELGGKDPAIVLASADIERATSAILTGSIMGAGHQCFSVERIYVVESVYEQFVEKLVEKAKKITLNFPDIKQGDIGPLIFEPQADIILNHLQDAQGKGAECLTGGDIEEQGGGLWCRPTVIVGVDHSMTIMVEETFGPVMPVMKVKDADEAVALANDSDYGLSACVFAGTEEEGLAVARRIDAGGISINDAGLAPHFIGDKDVAEKTAFKCSGLGGSRTGAESIKRFVRKRALLSNRSQQPSPWWYKV
ncbi:aldehyde dehydrogenase [Marinobacter sp. X15-166B]|nr:aldehyde dehydrogenase [Marinobacter sp. X15-166B]